MTQCLYADLLLGFFAEQIKTSLPANIEKLSPNGRYWLRKKGRLMLGLSAHFFDSHCCESLIAQRKS